MLGTRVVSAPVGENTPDHLRVFRDRMADAGIRVRLPQQSKLYKLPELVKLPGKRVSDYILEARGHTAE